MSFRTRPNTVFDADPEPRRADRGPVSAVHRFALRRARDDIVDLDEGAPIRIATIVTDSLDNRRQIAD